MLETKTENGILIINFKDTDRFNALISESVKEKLSGYFNKPNIRLVLDLKGIAFIDSSGFSALLSTMKAANIHQGVFKICNISVEVKELFMILQLHHVFEIYDTLEDSLASF